MRILRDSDIARLLAEPKPLPENWQSQFRTRRKSGYQHEERVIEITGLAGSVFRVILRRNRMSIFDFSIILVFQDDTGREYRLVRYNGRHASEHTNKWEKEQGSTGHKFGPAFHIHRATERYQEAGLPIDGFAEITASYHDFASALHCFIKDNNFHWPTSSQLSLLEEGETP